jgi:hypothetical protein
MWLFAIPATSFGGDTIDLVASARSVTECRPMSGELGGGALIIPVIPTLIPMFWAMCSETHLLVSEPR